MGQCMGLPVGAANSGIPIPFESPINTARSSAAETQNARVQIVTRQYGYDYLSSLPCLDSVNDCSKPGGTSAASEKGPRVKIREESESINALNRVMEEGNPEDKTLQDLTLILTQLMADASRNKCNELSLASDHGRLTLKVKPNGHANTYIPIRDNWPKEKKKKYPLINDKLTLSVLGVLYGKRALNKFLSDRYPGGAVSSAQRINATQLSARPSNATRSSARPSNAAQPSAKATQNSNIQIVTRSYMDDRNLLHSDKDIYHVPAGRSELDSVPPPLELDTKTSEKLTLMDGWGSVVVEGHPDAENLECLGLILNALLINAEEHGLNALTLASDHGRIILEPRSEDVGKFITTYIPVSNNCLEFKKEMHTCGLNAVAILAMGTLHDVRTAKNFLQGASQEMLARAMYDLTQSREAGSRH